MKKQFIIVLLLTLIGGGIPIDAQSLPAGLTRDKINTILPTLSPSQQQQATQFLNNTGATPKQTAKSEVKRQSPKKTEGPSSLENSFNASSQNPRYNPQLLNEMGKTLKDNENSLVKSTGRLKQFGYTIFQNTPVDKDGFTSIPVGPTYVLGPGDNLIVRIWGKLNEEFDITIDKTGSVYIPKVGQLAISGVKYGDIERVLRKKLEEKYTNFDVSVNIGKLRAIKVFILGNVKHPGAYDISSLSTVLTGLYEAGGPDKLGSLRDIRLIRNKKVIKNIDLYSYLLNGDRSQDPALEAFDTIFVPVIGPTFKLDGNVNRPGIFEINKKTSVYQAINTLGGGFNAHYYGRRIKVERVVDGSMKRTFDLSGSNPKQLKRALKQFILKSGDIVSVEAIDDMVFNEVSIYGNVIRPGRYEYNASMTVSDLIEKAEALLPDTYLKQAHLYRSISPTEKEILALDLSKTSDLNLTLNEFDHLQIFSNADINGNATVKIGGNVKKAGTYQLLKNMRVSDLVFLGGLDKDADLKKAELIRIEADGQKVYSIDIEAIKNNSNSDQNMRLKDRDEMFIRTDISKDDPPRVTIAGEIMRGGTYILKPNETLRDILKRAGGATEEGFIEGIVLKRLTVKALEEDSQQRALKEEKKRLVYDKTLISQAGVDNQETYQHIFTALNSREGSNDGRIVITVENNKIISDIPLEDGDSIYIPKVPSTIQVVGGVNNEAAFIYNPKYKSKQYIKMAGGFSEFADKKNILIIKANGSIEKNAKTVSVGDTIYVTEKIKVKRNILTALIDITKVLANLATTILLFDRL